MSCSDCEKFQHSDKTSYYRWGTATIEVRGCAKHLKEVFAALNKAQKTPAQEPQEWLCPECGKKLKVYTNKQAKAIAESTAQEPILPHRPTTKFRSK